MFRRLRKLFCRCAGGGREEDVPVESRVVPVEGAEQARQFALDAFFMEVLQKRLQEERESQPPTMQQFTLDDFFVELLQKRLADEREYQPPCERQYTLDAFFMELLERRLQEGE